MIWRAECTPIGHGIPQPLQRKPNGETVNEANTKAVSWTRETFGMQFGNLSTGSPKYHSENL